MGITSNSLRKQKFFVLQLQFFSKFEGFASLLGLLPTPLFLYVGGGWGEQTHFTQAASKAHPRVP